MRKYLLPSKGKVYKANLHCHSTVSDGKKTPEELKQLYMERGYSIIAFTDHEVFVGHNELSDENFLALNGWEYDTTVENTYIFAAPTCHINLIALDSDNLLQPFWHRTKYLDCGNAYKYAKEVQFDETKPDYERFYSVEKISEVMKTARDAGFYVIYNHPTFSLEAHQDYTRFEGMHAMEIFNGACLSLGYEEYNGHIYDSILKTGKKIFGVAGDDNHNDFEATTRYCDSFWAFTGIKAEKLDYKTITNALLNGDCFSSEGPEIYDLWYEDEKIYIRCSDVDKIYLTSDIRRTRILLSENGIPVNEATFEVPMDCNFFRITVVDKKGRRACTNAYFIEDLKDRN